MRKVIDYTRQILLPFYGFSSVQNQQKIHLYDWEWNLKGWILPFLQCLAKGKNPLDVNVYENKGDNVAIYIKKYLH